MEAKSHWLNKNMEKGKGAAAYLRLPKMIPVCFNTDAQIGPLESGE